MLSPVILIAAWCCNVEMDYNLLTGPLLLALRLFPVFSANSVLLASFSRLEHCNRLGNGILGFDQREGDE